MARDGDGLTAAMRRVLTAADELSPTATLDEIAARAGVVRTTVSRWRGSDPAFQAAWDERWRGAVKEVIPLAVLQQIRLAQRGSVPAARAVLVWAGLIPKRRRRRPVSEAVASPRPPTEAEIQPYREVARQVLPAVLRRTGMALMDKTDQQTGYKAIRRDGNMSSVRENSA